MATRKLRKEIMCRRCGVKLLVFLEERTVHCPSCGSLTVLQSRFNGNVAGNFISLPRNTQATGSSFAVHSLRQEPTTARVLVRVQPFHVSKPVSPSPAHGKKRAVLCGITYKGNSKSLKGSINDVLSIRNLLISRLGFPSSSIVMLTEEERDPHRIPTKHNIRASLRWLIQGCKSGDSLVFYYSGHGSRVRDLDGDEVDGYDESLLPVDYETEGRILDDEINSIIVRPLPLGATLHAIIDTCFSGTFLDLAYVCRIKSEGYYKWEDHRAAHIYKGSSGGLAISISACDDHQNSVDTTAFTGTATGALTHSFIKTLEQEPEITYGRLLIAMHEKIRKIHKQLGMKESQAQEPQLSASQMFEIHTKPFTI